jgi:hypothetical protein
MKTFLDVAACSLVQADRHFRVRTASIIRAITFFTYYFYETTRHTNPEGCYLHI